VQTSTFGGFAGIVFDAYGTLFDVVGIESHCALLTERSEEFARIWRSKQLDYAILRTIMDRYADWGQITSDALDYTASLLRVELTPTARRSLMDAWLDLPTYPDVPAALDRLSAADLRLLILSNGTRQMLEPVLRRNGLTERFQGVLTSEAVQAFKPEPSIYGQVTDAIHARINEILFVTANGFDVAGAKAVGFTVCRVDRRGDPLDPLGLEPDIHVRDLGDLVDRLLGPQDDSRSMQEGSQFGVA
jgi:2-haloacid dehalogenase